MSIKFLLIIILYLALVSSFKIPSNPFSKSNINIPFEKISKNIKAKTIPVLLGLPFLFGNPSDSNALQSGSRSGGSSFSRGSSGGSSTRTYSSRPSSTINIVPSYGYGQSFFSPWAFNPFYSPVYVGGGGMFGGLSNIIFVGGLIFLATRLIGKSGSFFDENGIGSESATVVKLNIALNADWSRDSVIRALSDLANNGGDLSSRRDLARLLSETSLLLLRRQDSWVGVSHESKSLNDNQSIESQFQRYTIKERMKFEKETKPMLNYNSNELNSPTIAVVSLIVALKGNNNPSYKSVRSLVDTKECLQSLAADSLTVSLY